MDDFQKDIITRLVYIFTEKAHISDQAVIDNKIASLCSMTIDDAVDDILVAFYDLLSRKLISSEDIYQNCELIYQLNLEKYSSVDDLINRLNWIRAMNMEHPSMSKAENHKLILEAFDSFNELLEGRFDCYYTGGLMGYLATNHELERFHGDLDLFINEQQLVALKESVDLSPDFKFVSNMDHKNADGHEYKIMYKDTPISVGLFLFERQLDESITTKSYYFENQDSLFVDEQHFSASYTDMSFSNTVRYHNGYPYKMMSLESIYNLKKDSRPKDKYDAEIIKNSVDMALADRIDNEKNNTIIINHKIVPHSIIQIVEELIQAPRR